MTARVQPKTRRLAQFFSRFAGLVLLLVVLVLTLSDDVARPQFIVQQDKVEHLLAFLGLGLFFGWGASALGLAACGLGLGAAAFAIEGLQEMLTAHRQGALADAAASLIGLLAGLAGAAALSALVRRIGGADWSEARSRAGPAFG